MSAKKFTGPSFEDKEGNSIWRVVVFKTALEHVKSGVSSLAILSTAQKLSPTFPSSVKKINLQVDKSYDILRNLYKAAWSGVFIGWMHIKAMRIFVESVLRYGMPPKFACFIVATKNGATAGMRKEFAAILG